MSGTHGTLAVRTLIAHEQKIECVATAAHLLETLKSDYGNLLSFFEVKDSLLSSNFVDDIKSWPNTNIGQIFAYFWYKFQKAYTFFKSGFVDKLLVKSVEEERTINRASVTPSQRLNVNKHQLWIVFKSDGSVITGFCNLQDTADAATILLQSQCYTSSAMQMKKGIQTQLVQMRYVIGIHHQRKLTQ